VVRFSLVGLFVVLAFAGNARALCGDVNDDGQRSATDALMVLNVAVGQVLALNCSCGSCGTSEDGPAAKAHCADASGDTLVTASDALRILNVAVGQSVPLDCSCDACGSATTTTTIPGCPAPDGLDGRSFNEIYTCIQSFGGDEPFCADSNEGDTILFTHIGGGSYEIRDVPDTGFLYEGTIGCTTFTWVAQYPGEYTEQGTGEFSSDLESFSGSSIYVADDFSYSGSCNETGAEAPATPPNPTPIAPCP
jgi:hypothetical protein